jgi:hypothetical protein
VDSPNFDDPFGATYKSEAQKRQSRAAAEEFEATKAVLVARGIDELTIMGLPGLVMGLNGLVLVYSLAIFLLPDFFHILSWMGAALPWIAICMVWKYQPFCGFDALPGSERPVLLGLLVGPALGLFCAASSDGDFDSWVPVLIAAVAVNTLLLGAVYLAAPASRKSAWMPILVMAFCLPYGIGIILTINSAFDFGASRLHRYKVISKYVDNSRSHKRTYYKVRIVEEGLDRETSTIRPPHSDYLKWKPGDPVCLVFHDGALRIKWSELKDCANLSGQGSRY